jgi:hypothetical protein
MSNQIFISHAEEDADRANAVVRALEERGARCWIAPRDITPGTTWGGAISQAIAASRLMVLFVSRKANESQHVLREVERAVSRRVPVIPLRLERLELSPDLEFYLGAPQWLDASRMSDGDLLESLTRSIEALAPGTLRPERAVPPRLESGPLTARSGARGPARLPAWPLVTAGAALITLVAAYAAERALDGRNDDQTARMVTQDSVRDRADTSAVVNRLPQEGRDSAVPPVRSRRRPLRIGSSIGTPHSSAGSIGAFAMDERGGRYLITTRDVFGNGFHVGTPVLQPGPLDGGRNPRDRIGTVTKYFPYTNGMDAAGVVALVRLDDSVRVDAAIPGIGPVSGFRPVDGSLLGASVRKYGRGSGLTTGFIQAIHVNFPDLGLKDAIQATLTVTGGDSGALVIDHQNRAIGLIIGGGGENAVIVPLDAALARLGVRLFTQ